MLTIQMGMVPYALQKQFSDKVYFVDMRGLTTTHLSRCQDFSAAPINWQGIFITYAEYFSAQKRGECDLPQTDIIFDLLPIPGSYNEKRLAAIKSNGYTVIVMLQGRIKASYAVKSQDATSFIAIRNDLYHQLPSSLQWQEYEFMYH